MNYKKPVTQTSSPPTRPPKPPVVAVGVADSGSENIKKPVYGCHEALWALDRRYHSSDIHGAYTALVEQEELLRQHIRFPSYNTKLVFTMVKRSDIALHLGDPDGASAIMANALELCREIPNFGSLTSDFLLKITRSIDTRLNVKWRHSNHTA